MFDPGAGRRALPVAHGLQRREVAFAATAGDGVHIPVTAPDTAPLTVTLPMG